MVTEALLGFHIIAGTSSLLAGAASMTVRKGFRLHRLFGKVFALAMLGMTGSGVVIAFVQAQPDNLIVGALTFYLVATGWLTVIRKIGKTGRLEVLALLGVLSIIAIALSFAWETANSTRVREDGLTATNFYGMALVGGSFAALDIKMLIQGGVTGTQRTLRHLWRMGLAMFVATLSLFVGQAMLFPEAVQTSHLLIVPVMLVVGITLYWVLRVRFFNHAVSHRS